MKKTFYLFVCLLAYACALNAQSFSVQRDSVYYTYSGNSTINISDSIYSPATGADSVTLEWQVVSTDFPSDWKTYSGIGDNRNYYSFIGIWPPGAPMYSGIYSHGWGDFHLQTNLSAASSSGTHYLTLRLRNYSMPDDSATVTFIVTRAPVAVPNISRSYDDAVLYPNPARGELNVVYDAAADVKNITVYNIIGKVMAVYKVTDNSSANLNLENIPSGVYLLRLINSHGQMVATRKFTKQ